MYTCRILARNRLYMYMLFLLFSSIAGFIQVQPFFYLNPQVVTAFLISSHIHFLLFVHVLFSGAVVALHPWRLVCSE